MKIDISFDELFKNKKERDSAIEALKTLNGSKGWKILESIIDKDLDKLDNKLKFETFDNLSDQQKCQEKYAHLFILKNYPKRIVEILSDESVEKVEFDPYLSESSKEVIDE